MTDGRSPRWRSAVLVAAVAVALALGAVAVGPAGGMDGSMVLYFEESDIEAEAGETVTIDLVADAHGNSVGNGIASLSATIEYDADAMTVTDVEPGPMLAAGDENASVEATETIEEGVVTIDQERTPTGSGATATETAATLTIEIADDAATANEPLVITDSRATYPSGYGPDPVEREAEISIAGTTDSVPGFGPPGAFLALAAAVWLFVRRFAGRH